MERQYQCLRCGHDSRTHECEQIAHAKMVDLQRALDAEREKVKGLEALLVGFDGQDEVIEMEKSAYYALRDKLATLQAQLRQVGEDARRYRRLQVLGCAPSTSKQLENGTVLCFTNLDEFVDAALNAASSRGEAATLAAQDAGKEVGNGL